MRILIAEDDSVSALLLQRMLIKENHNVVTTVDGTEALAAIKAESFDALLTD